MDKWKDELFGNVIKTAILWVLLQAICGWRAMLALLGYGYDVGTWIGMGFYIVSLFALDIALFRLNTVGAAKGWVKYWGLCGVIFFLARFSGTDVFEATAEMLLTVATPYYVLYPLWDCLLDSKGYMLFVFLLCAAHMAYFWFLARRAKKK